MKLHNRLILIAISLFFIWLAFPIPDKGIFAWIALIPALIAFNETGFRKGVLLGEVFGIGFIAIVINWFGVFGELPLIAGAIHFGLYFALFFSLYGWYTKKFPERTHWQHYIIPPLLWAGIEWFKSRGILGFCWGSLGFTQYKFPALLQLASITGVYGISFVIVFVNNLIAQTLIAINKYGNETGFRPWKQLPGFEGLRGVFRIISELVKTSGENPALRYSWLAFIFFFPGILILGRLSIPMELKFGDYESISDKSFKVGIVQPNMPQDIKWKPENYLPTLQILKEGTKSLADNGAKMVVWPETSIPHRYPLGSSDVRNYLTGMARDNNIYLITGIMDRNKLDQQLRYNTAVMIDPDGTIAGKYNKIHLVPLGEYFPFPKKYRKKLKIFDRIGDYTHGKEVKIFDTKYGKFSILICFESMFPDLARVGVKNGAKFILVITNDAWFMRGNAAKTHFIMAAFRAVENRVWVIQSANTGESGIVDPWGKMLSETEIYTRTNIDGQIYPMDQKAIYTYIGDSFSIFCLVAALAGMLLPLLIKDRKQGNDSKAAKKGKKEFQKPEKPSEINSAEITPQENADKKSDGEKAGKDA